MEGGRAELAATEEAGAVRAVAATAVETGEGAQEASMEADLEVRRVAARREAGRAMEAGFFLSHSFLYNF